MTRTNERTYGSIEEVKVRLKEISKHRKFANSIFIGEQAPNGRSISEVQSPSYEEILALENVLSEVNPQFPVTLPFVW